VPGEYFCVATQQVPDTILGNQNKCPFTNGAQASTQCGAARLQEYLVNCGPHGKTSLQTEAERAPYPNGVAKPGSNLACQYYES